MTKNIKEDSLVFYKDEKGRVELRADAKGETIWASQQQISDLFEVDIRTVNEHLINIFESDELKEVSTIRNFRIVQNEGNRKINRIIKFYNLDAIIAVGYRVNSKKATNFRIWATNVLREHLLKGYSINKLELSRSNEKFDDLIKTVSFIESKFKNQPVKGNNSIKLSKDLDLKKRAFTLIEVLVVIGIIAVLAAVVLVAVNPARQFKLARDSQRTSNVNTILNAIGQNISEHKGLFYCNGASKDIPTIPTYIKSSESSGGIDLAYCLVPDYVSSLPYDPSAEGAFFNSTSSYNTMYQISRDINGRITASSSGELTANISVTR